MFKITSKKISFILLALFLGGLFFSFLPQAQALQVTNYPGVLSNLRSRMNLNELISILFKFILLMAGLAAFIMIVWGGVKYLTSAGDPARTKDAKNQVFMAILGLIILFASWMILNTINPQLVELQNPSTLPGPSNPTWNPVRIPGVCVSGASYDVELYPDVSYGGDLRNRQCFNLGEEEKSFNGKIYSIKVNKYAVRLFDESNLSGRNICFKGNVPDLHRCILSGANDCNIFGYAGWERVWSLKVINPGDCSEPGMTLSYNGQHIGEKCIFGDPIDIPVCMYQ